MIPGLQAYPAVLGLPLTKFGPTGTAFVANRQVFFRQVQVPVGNEACDQATCAPAPCSDLRRVWARVLQGGAQCRKPLNPCVVQPRRQRATASLMFLKFRPSKLFAARLTWVVRSAQGRSSASRDAGQPENPCLPLPTRAAW